MAKLTIGLAAGGSLRARQLAPRRRERAQLRGHRFFARRELRSNLAFCIQ